MKNELETAKERSEIESMRKKNAHARSAQSQLDLFQPLEILEPIDY